MAKKKTMVKKKSQLDASKPVSTDRKLPDQKSIPVGVGKSKAAGGGKKKRIGMKKAKKC